MILSLCFFTPPSPAERRFHARASWERSRAVPRLYIQHRAAVAGMTIIAFFPNEPAAGCILSHHRRAEQFTPGAPRYNDRNFIIAL